MPLIKRIRYNAPVTLTFVILSGIVLLLGAVSEGTITYRFFCVYRFSPTDILGYLRLFTHVLGHSGLEHYAGNMTLILILGPMLEEKYGGRTLLLAILSTAFITGAVQCLFSSGGLMGASGIVFMMIMLSSLTSFKTGTIPLTLILTGVIYLGGELINGFTLNDGVSQVTHIVGGVCGTAIGYLLAGNKRE